MVGCARKIRARRERPEHSGGDQRTATRVQVTKQKFHTNELTREASIVITSGRPKERDAEGADPNRE